MVMSLASTVASDLKASGDLRDGKFALSLHAALQSMEPFQKQQPSSTGSDSPPSEESGTDQPKRDFQPYHAQSVPKSENLQTLADAGDVQVTTLMFRNIPNKYTQNTLLREIDEFGFTDTYNFFYLPMDVHNRSNVGYAFINFETPNDAERFRAVFSEHRFQRFNSRKIGGVCTAHVQGLEENVRHFENRAVTQAKNDQYRPIVLKARQRIEFEDAVAEVKASGLLSSSHAPVAGIADARLGLEAAIRDLLSSSADSTPSLGATPEYASPPPGLLPHPARVDEPAYVPMPAGLYEPAYLPVPAGTKALFSWDPSSNACHSKTSDRQSPQTTGLILGALLSSKLHASEPARCA